MNSQDGNILRRYGSIEVHAHKQEVMFKDGTSVWLHDVARDGLRDKHLRTMSIGAGGEVLFDLRKVAPSLSGDMCVALQRDEAGLVYFTLRNLYPNATAFRARVDVGPVTPLEYANADVPLQEAA